MLNLEFPNYSVPFDPYWLYARSREDIENIGYVYSQAKDADIRRAMEQVCKFYHGWDEDGTGWTMQDSMIAMCDFVKFLNKIVNGTDIELALDQCGFELKLEDGRTI